MLIDNLAPARPSLPSIYDELHAQPAAPWISPPDFQEHLLALCRIPVGAVSSPRDGSEAERLCALASPTKQCLDAPVPHLYNSPLPERLCMIEEFVRDGRLHVEHARRLLVPDEPSWLHNLDTEYRVSTAEVMFQDIARGFRDERASDTGRALFRALLEIEGDSPSRVLLNIRPAGSYASQSQIDREKVRLAGRVLSVMDRMGFTPAEIEKEWYASHRQSPPLPA